MSDLEVITAGPNRALHRRKARETRVTAAKRDAFLEELGASCNVRRASAAAGMSDRTFYKLRHRDAGFDADWEVALATGYAKLEAELLAEALRESDGGGDGDGREPFDRDLAIKVLGRRDAKARSGHPGAYGRRSRTRHVPIADVEAALLRQLELLEKRLKGCA